jgi:long-chain acyl-CoA synthetase
VTASTLPELFADIAARYPGKPAIIDSDRTYTYEALHQRSRLIAHRLREAGIGPGGLVSIYLPNGADFLASFLAIVRLGAAAAPLNAHYRDRELIRYLGDCAPGAIVTSTSASSRCRSIAGQLSGACQVCEADGDFDGPAEDIASAATPGGRALVQYSSGSTGAPKRIARTHANLVAELKALAHALDLTDADRFLATVPFSHVNGLVRTLLASQSVGATVVAPADFQRQKTAAAIGRERVTVLIAVPFVFGMLADTNFGTGADFSTIRLAVSASSPMPPAINRRFHARHGQYVRQLYGSTETGTISVNLSNNIAGTLDSVGAPLDGVDVAIVTDEGAPVVPGHEGEVAVRSPFAITAYEGPGADQPFRDGYFLTGDIGRQDEQGRLYLIGRRTFFINKGGYKINPREVESLLEEHPHVREAVVVGVPSLYGDERVKAVVVCDPPCSAQELLDYCRGRIADFKSPSVIEFRDSLPRTAAGKVMRSEL